MKAYKVRKNWFILFVTVTPMALLVAYCDLIITQQELSRRLTAGFNPAALAATYVVSFILVSGLIADMLTELLTKYTSEGVDKVTFRGIKSVKWKDITSVKGYSRVVNLNYLELRGEGRKVRINTLFYRDIDGLIELIKSQAPNARWE